MTTDRLHAVILDRRDVLTLGALAATATVLAACGSTTASAAPGTTTVASAGPPEPAPAGDAIVTLLPGGPFDPVLDPPDVTVARGETVTWQNDSGEVHTVTCDPDNPLGLEHSLPEGAESFNSGNIAPDDTFQHTFEVAGTYIYGCALHEAHAGTITVS